MEELQKKYRFKDNPEEEMFYEGFEKFHQDRDLNYSRIAFPSLDGDTPVSFLNEREVQITKNVIQWLGSPVGQGFLAECGYTKNQ